jgi:hypothetical protein
MPEPGHPEKDTGIVESGCAADPLDHKAREQDHGLGQIHTVAISPERPAPDPALGSGVSLPSFDDESPRAAVVPPQLGWVVFILSAA